MKTIMTGWTCPNCGQSHSPLKITCGCVSSITSNATTYSPIEQPSAPVSGNPIAYEFYNPKTGHCYVDYIRRSDIEQVGDGEYTQAPLFASQSQSKPAIVEKYPVIAIDEIDAETVKRWYQELTGIGESEMKHDIHAIARASHLNKHLNWDDESQSKQERSSTEQGKSVEEVLREVILESDYFISEDHWVWDIAIKAMEEYANQSQKTVTDELYEPYHGWCDVDKCDKEASGGGIGWKETGYWRLCSDHHRMEREGKKQPKMKPESIKRESSRDKKTGYLIKGK